MNKNKYIKLIMYPEGDTVLYRVIETRNINFVEPGYEYQVQRPKTFKDLFEPGYFENIEVHLIEDNEPRGTSDRPIFVTTPTHNPIEAVNGNE
jgi:hypothetical protein